MDSNPFYFSNLGIALQNQGKLDEAIAAYLHAIGIKPDYAEVHSNLGIALKSQRKLDEAIAACRRAISIKPDYVEAHYNLGNALKDQGKLDEAIAAYFQAIGIKPDFAEAHSNLGTALQEQGKLAEAIAAYRRAIDFKPDFAEAHSNLGAALRDQGKLAEAIAAYRQAIGIKPDFAEAYSNLGTALQDQGALAEAIAAYRQAIGIKPYFAEAHFNLGTALRDQGKLDEAIAACQQAIGIKRDYAEAFSHLLFCLNYHDQLTADGLFAAHREWDARFGGQVARPIAYANDREMGRRLRIGYVSPDFRSHSVAYFMAPLLKEHDRRAVEIFCYAEVARPDMVTAQLHGLADHWLVTVGLSDDELAERLRADGIDILVDLAGHTAKNRLGVFARKPAPVQVTWLGYPNTTGLEAIDYRLVDAVTDPIGEADAWASETLIRLEGGFLCYGGLQGAPEPAVPPCLETGTVTFGSFNNPTKVSASTFDAWARLLARLPHARLLLKGKQFADAATRALFLAKLGDRGVAVERVALVAWQPSSTAHLALYDRVDVALDPFPYNGTTTTCEALSMGVPVVTLRGDRHAGRVGASLLSQVGLTDLIANSVEEYIDIALALAGDPERLLDLRRTLRPRLAASPLCDGPAFSRKIEAAFRLMWWRWCETSLAAAELLEMGINHHHAGRLSEAEACYRRVLAAQPEHADALHLLGVISHQVRRSDEAVTLIGQAIKQSGQIHFIFPTSAMRCETWASSTKQSPYRRAIDIKPDYAEAHSNLGTALTRPGQARRSNCRISPGDQHQAGLCRGPFQPRQCVAETRAGSTRQSPHIAGRSTSNPTMPRPIPTSAMRCETRASSTRQSPPIAGRSASNPTLPRPISTSALRCRTRASSTKPSPPIAGRSASSPTMPRPHSNLLFCLNYYEKVTADQLFAAHREWDARFGRQAPRPTAYANDREAGRRLRIGYVSPDFRLHSVAYFVEPLLQGHDRQAVEVFCYAEVARPDMVTARLQGLADHWLVTVGLSDDELAERIRADGIDILVDLAGHTAKNRLGVFARKPAPVQVTWLGYPNTTGLDAIDYRLVDAVTDPIGEADAWASETLVRLEGGFLCYGGLQGAPEPAVPPCFETGTVTFGSFNNPTKVSAATFDAWARLLARLPQARLLLKGKPFADAATRALFLARLGERGVAAERVELVAWLPSRAAHLALYDRIDIALDPFPYNGTTTTCEALWMGVPVVTLRGDRHAGRVGASLLSQIGLTDLIADSVEEYVEIAVALAGDPERLDDLRRSLRPRLAASPLCDGQAFARKIEAAFRNMWQRWCETPGDR